MDDRPYLYRLRGRTLGPVGLRQIRQLAQRAQIGRLTDVSRDGVQWSKAGDFPEIFEAVEVPPPLPGPSAGGFPAIDLAPAPGPTAVATWYYAIAGIQKGPVDLATLQRMVAGGQLAGTDHVFPEGGSDWLTVTSVPELAGAAGVGGAPVIKVNVPRQTAQTEGSNGLAIAGFVLSLFPCLSVIGLILSIVALSGRNTANRGLAIAGVIIGGLVTLGVIGYLVAAGVMVAANS